MTELSGSSGIPASAEDDTVRATRALSRVARMLERALPPGISLADYRMLSAIAEGEARASRLAHRLAVGKPSVIGMVDSLVRRGLVARAVADGDQRAVDLAVTDAGETARAEAQDALSALVADIAGRTADPAGTLAALAAFGDGVEARQAEVAASRARGAVR